MLGVYSSQELTHPVSLTLLQWGTDHQLPNWTHPSQTVWGISPTERRQIRRLWGQLCGMKRREREPPALNEHMEHQRLDSADTFVFGKRD